MSGYDGTQDNCLGIRFRAADPLNLPRVSAYAIPAGLKTFARNTSIMSATGVPSEGPLAVHYDTNTELGNFLDIRTLQEVDINSGTDFNVQLPGDNNIEVGGDFNVETDRDINLKANGVASDHLGRDVNIESRRNINIYGLDVVSIGSSVGVAIGDGSSPITFNPPLPPGGGIDGEVKPSGFGFKACNMSPASASANYQLVDSYIFLQKVMLGSETLSVSGIGIICDSPTVPTVAIASLWTFDGADLATLVEEIDAAQALFANYGAQSVPFAAPRNVTGDNLLIGVYCRGGTMPYFATTRSGGTTLGGGFGPGISKRANSFAFLGSVTSMPATINLAACSALNDWLFSAFV